VDVNDLQTLIDLHYARIRRTAFGLCGDASEADEISQETFLAVLKSRSSPEDNSKVINWLIGICVNVHRSRIRSTMRRLRRATRWFVMHGAHRNIECPALESEVREWQQGIWDSVRKLPTLQREVIVLRFIEELTVPQIAVIVGCPEGTVKSRLSLALGKLRQLVEPQSMDGVAVEPMPRTGLAPDVLLDDVRPSITNSLSEKGA